MKVQAPRSHNRPMSRARTLTRRLTMLSAAITSFSWWAVPVEGQTNAWWFGSTSNQWQVGGGPPTVQNWGSTTSAASATLPDQNTIVRFFSGSSGTSALSVNSATATARGFVVESSYVNNLTLSGSNLAIGDLGVTNSTQFTVTFDNTLSTYVNAGIGNTGGVFNFNAGTLGAIRVNSVLTGANSLNKFGAGILTLTANNTHSGPTTLSAGTLQLGFGTATGMVPGNINSTGGTLAFSRSDNFTWSNALTGSAGLVKVGGNTITFTGASSYTGPTSIDVGEINVASNGRLGTGTLTLNANAALRLSTNDVWGNHTTTSSAPITVNPNNTLIANGSFNTLVNLTVNGGQLVLSGGSSPDFPALALKGTFSFTGSTPRTVAATGGTNNAINVGPTEVAGQTVFAISDVTASSAVDLSIAVPLQDNRNNANTAYNANGIRKTGPGTLALSAATTFTGRTTLEQGTILLNHASAFGAANTLTFTGGTLTYSAVNALDLSARLKDSTSPIVLDTAGQGVNYASAIDASNTAGLIKNGTGFLNLRAANTFTGPLVINAGELRLGANAAGGVTGDITVAAAGTLTFFRTDNHTLPNNISGSGFLNKVNTLNTVTLTGNLASTLIPNTSTGAIQFGDGVTSSPVLPSGNYFSSNNAAFIFNPAGTTTFSGTISGSAHVTKAGPGQINWTTLGHTYTGTSSVTGGVLDIRPGGRLSASTAAVVVDGGTLRLSQTDIFGLAHTTTTTPPITVRNGGQIQSNASFNTLVNLNLNNGSLGLNGGLSSSFPAFGLKGTVTVSGSIPSSFTTLGGANNLINIGPSDAPGTLTFNVADVTSNSAIDLNVDAVLQNQQNMTSSGFIPSGLIKVGSGTMNLVRPNTYTGPTTILAGTLRLAAPNAIPVASAVTIGNGARLLSALSDPWGNHNTTTSPSITVNAGGILENAQGTFATLISPALAGGTIFTNGGITPEFPSFGLKGTVTVTGSVFSRIAAGTGTNVAINIGPSDAPGSLTLSVPDVTASSATDFLIEVPLQNQQNAASNGALASGLNKTGPGTLVLAAGGAYTGTTQLLGGTLQVGNGGAVASFLSNITSSASTAVAFNLSNTLTYPGAISGPASLTKSGSGLLILTANSTFTGNTQLLAGTLQLGDGGTSGSITGNVSGTGGTLAVNRSDDFTLDAVLTGIGLSLTKLGTGTLTIPGPMAYTGTTTLSGGTLVVSVADSIGTGPIVFNGGTLRHSPTLDEDFSSRFSPASTGPISIDTGGATVGYASPLISPAGVVKLGEGELVSTRTHTGPLTISGGTFMWAPSSPFFTFSGNVANNAVLSFNLQTSMVASFADTISGVGAVALVAGGTLDFSQPQTYSGPTTVNAGELRLSDAATLLNTASVTVSNAGLSLITSNVFGPASVGTTPPVVLNSSYLVTSGSFNTLVSPTFNNGYIELQGGLDATYGALSLKGTVSTSGTTTLTSSAGSNNFILIGPSDAPGALTLNVSGTTTVEVPLRDQRNDANTAFLASGLFKVGGGTLVLSAANTYTGPTLVNGGALHFTAAGTTSPLSSITLSGGTSLRLQRADTWGDSDDLASTPSITVPTNSLIYIDAGPNTLTQLSLSGGGVSVGAPLRLKGTVTVTGGTSQLIGSGADPRISLGLSASPGTTTFDVAPGSTLNVDVVRFQDNSPGASLIKAGQGTINVSTASLYTGTTTFAGGTFVAANPAAPGTSGPLVFTGGTLRYSGHATDYSPRILNSSGPVSIDTNNQFVTFSTPLPASNTGGLTKLGSGTLTLSGPHLYSGTTAAVGGTLEVAGALPNTSFVNVVNSTLRLTGTNALGSPSAAQPPISAANALIDLRAPNTLGALTLFNSQLNLLDIAGPFGTSYALKGPVTDTGNSSSIPSYLGYLGNPASLTVGPVDAPGTFAVTVANTGGVLFARAFLRDARNAADTADLPTNLSKSGQGTLAFQRPWLLTGTVTASGGTLSLSRDSALYPSLYFDSAPVLDIQPSTSLSLESANVFSPLSATAGPSVLLRATSSLVTYASPNLLVSPSFQGGQFQASNSGSLSSPQLSLKGTVSFSSGFTFLGTGASTYISFGPTDAPGSTTFDVVLGSTAFFNSTLTDSLAEPAFTTPLASTLIKTGSGLMILNQFSNHTGGTRVLAGTLQLGNGSTSGGLGGNVSVAASGTLAINLSGNFTLAGVVSGAGTLVQSGAGFTTLTAVNPLTGRVSVTAGTLSIAATGSIASASQVSVSGSGTLRLSVTDHWNPRSSTTPAPLALGPGGTLELANSHNTFTDLSAANATTVRLSGGLSADLPALGLKGTFTTNGSVSVVTGSGSFNSVAIGPTDAPGSLTVNTLSGTSGFFVPLADARNNANTTNLPSGLVKTGPGTLTLSAVNTFTGPVTVSAGTLRLTTFNALRSFHTVTATGGTVSFSASNLFGSNTITASPSFVLNAGSILENSPGSGSYNTLVSPVLAGGTLRANDGSPTNTAALGFVGTLSVIGSTPSTLALGTGSNARFSVGPSSAGTLTVDVADVTSDPATDLFIDAPLINARNALNTTFVASGLVKTGLGRLTLRNSASYTGATTVNAGTFELGAGATLTGPITVTGSGSTLLFSRPDTFGSHTVTATPVVSIRNGATLDTGGFFNTLVNLDLQGATVLIRDGASINFPALGLKGTVSFSGTVASTFSTTGSVNAFVRVGPSNTSGSLTLNVADGPAVVDAFIQASFANQLANSGGFQPSGIDKTGPGLLALDGTSTYTGDSFITQGTLRPLSPAALSTGRVVFQGGTLQFAPGSVANYGSRISNAPHTADISIDTNGLNVTFSAVNASRGIVKLGAGTLTFTGNSFLSTPSTITAGTVLISNGFYSGTVTNNASLVFDISTSNFGHTFPISGTGTLIKRGAGGLTLTAGNTYTGPTLIEGGFLALNNTSTTQSITINPGTNLSLNVANAFGANNTTPATDIILLDSGTLSYNTNFFTVRNLVLSGASLSLVGGNPTEAAAFAVRNTLSVTGSAPSTVTATGGTNNLLRGGGTSAQALAFDIPDVTASPATDLFFNIATASNVRLTGGSLSNSSVAKTGAGTLLFGVQQSHTSLRLDAGTVAASSALLVSANLLTFNGGVLRAPAGDVSVRILSSTAPIRYDTDGGTVTWAGTLASTNTAGLEKLGTGRLTLTAFNNFPGPVLVSGGTLAVSGSGTLPATSPITVNATGELLLLRSDVFGLYSSSNSRPIVINAGGTLSTSNTFTSFTNLTLAGGTVSLTGGLNANAGAVAFKSQLLHTSTTSASTVTATGTNAFALIGPTSGGSLLVSVTDSPAPIDLLLAVPLRDARDSGGFTQPLTSGLIKSGTGTLALAAEASFSGPLSIDGGTVSITPTGSLSSVSSISITSGATLALGIAASPTTSTLALPSAPAVTLAASGTLRLDTPTATVAGRTLNPLLAVFPSLSIANDGAPLGSTTYSGLLDLGTNDALFPAAVGGLAALTDLARAFVASAAANGGLGTQGLGSTSTIPFTAIALVPNTDPFGLPRFTSFNGQPVGGGDVIAKFTYLGDTDLNGVLDARDFNTVLSNFSNGTVGAGWGGGDLNYDGVTNALDWQLFLPAFSNYLANPAPLGDTNPATYPAGGAIPEPAALALLSLPALSLTRRRPPT